MKYEKEDEQRTVKLVQIQWNRWPLFLFFFDFIVLFFVLKILLKHFRCNCFSCWQSTEQYFVVCTQRTNLWCEYLVCLCLALMFVAVRTDWKYEKRHFQFVVFMLVCWCRSVQLQLKCNAIKCTHSLIHFCTTHTSKSPSLATQIVLSCLVLC